MTAHMPPTPPATRDRSPDDAAFLACTISSLISSLVVGIDGKGNDDDPDGDSEELDIVMPEGAQRSGECWWLSRGDGGSN